MLADTEINGIESSSKEVKLNLEYLPGYAKFLLEERLDVFSKEILRISQSLNLPVLKYFDFLPEEKLVELTKEAYAIFFRHLIDNTVEEYLEINLKKWSNDQLPLVAKDQIVVEDITLGTHARRKAFTQFLPEYTQDPKLLVCIVNELDEMLLKNESASFELFINIQQKKINSSNETLADKNRELERSNKELMAFSYVASHDLQEPLRKIKLFTNLITERESEIMTDSSQRMFGKITASVTRMQRLIDDLLSFSRVNSKDQEWEQVSLDNVLLELKSQYKDQIDGKTMILDIGPMPIVRGAAFQYYQLFENIVGNSVKYAQDGVQPHITISSEIVTGKDLNIEQADLSKRYNRIVVTDNGIGFDQKNSDKIFEIFQRLHGRDEYSGTGIGLAICKKIVHGYNGFIYATGEVNKGATFYICLPIV